MKATKFLAEQFEFPFAAQITGTPVISKQWNTKASVRPKRDAGANHNPGAQDK